MIQNNIVYYMVIYVDVLLHYKVKRILEKNYMKVI